MQDGNQCRSVPRTLFRYAGRSKGNFCNVQGYMSTCLHVYRSLRSYWEGILGAFAGVGIEIRRLRPNHHQDGPGFRSGFYESKSITKKKLTYFGKPPALLPLQVGTWVVSRVPWVVREVVGTLCIFLHYRGTC